MTDDLVFGIRTATCRSSHMLELYELMEKLSSIFEIGATPPVDILPVLKYLPQSLFNNWKTKSSAVGEAIDTLYDPLVSHVIQRRSRNGSSKSFLDNVLDQQDKLQLTRHELNLMCGNLTEGGSDTTSSMILVFIQAMLRYPDVQREAQKQIDFIIGEERSPEWIDYDRLPYVAMIVKETMRWRPVAPLAFPHALTKGESLFTRSTIPVVDMVKLLDLAVKALTSNNKAIILTA